jgi:hypothetical protein
MASHGSRRIEAFNGVMAKAEQLMAAGDPRAAFPALERAHVLGQLEFVPHLRVHWSMLRVGWRLGDRRGIVGQLKRIALVPADHLIGRLPIGNTGRANVSAFEPMALPPYLGQLLNDKET